MQGIGSMPKILLGFMKPLPIFQNEKKAAHGPPFLLT
jgi:hypothetical protein